MIQSYCKVPSSLEISVTRAGITLWDSDRYRGGPAWDSPIAVILTSAEGYGVHQTSCPAFNCCHDWFDRAASTVDNDKSDSESFKLYSRSLQARSRYLKR